MVRVFLSKFLRAANSNDINEIVRYFKEYKVSKNSGDLFGRDESLTRPSAANLAKLKHVHMLKPEDIKKAFRRKGIRKKMPVIKAIELNKITQFDLTSDAFLIYCHGMLDTNNLLVIDIIWDDAHTKVRNTNRMISYAEEAERFYNSGK